MSVLVNRDSKIIVQGFTGGEGTFHAGQMIEYGTNVVGGVTPWKGSQTHLDRPVFNTVADAVAETGADVSIVFVPPAFAADALMEAADAGIKVIVAITEGIPVADMVKVKATSTSATHAHRPQLPWHHHSGSSESGHHARLHLRAWRGRHRVQVGHPHVRSGGPMHKAGLGQTTAIGIGGDPIIGTTTLEAVKLLMADDETKGIVMIGEIGGDLEVKLRVGFKRTAPSRRRLHRGRHGTEGTHHGPRGRHRVRRRRVGRSEEACHARVRHPRGGQPCRHRLQDGRGPWQVNSNLRNEKPDHLVGLFHSGERQTQQEKNEETHETVELGVLGLDLS